MTSSNDAGIEFRVLGPVEAVRDGSVLQLGGRRQRALLALLLLEPGRSVSVDRLSEELWDGAPSAGAATSLRVYVSRLRSALAQDAVVAQPPGYLLAVEPERIDATRFERLLRDGRDALDRGAAGLAADRLGAALELWRGPALCDVADGGALTLEAQRLDELRVACREAWVDAELALGRHGELVAELERLVAEHPLRERLWQQLVLALYRNDRQADALAAYQRARSLLADELGLEPSEELRALERAVLRQEVAAAPVTEPRHNLPAQVTSFVGRERELADLERLLREHRLVTVTGMGGAGKTRLAVETALRQVGVWSGGVSLVDLMPVSEPGLVPAAVARTLAVADRPDVTPLVGLLDRLRGLELLLVLDNCEHVAGTCAELTGEVLRTCPDIRVLATSRLPLGAVGEVEYALEPLATPSDDAGTEEIEASPSVRLFLDRGRSVRHDLATEQVQLPTVGRICRELDGLPLAIELASARAKALSLDEIAALLDDRFRFLRSWRRVADSRHRTLRATMDWSFELLSDEERDLLARLSVFAGGFDLDAVAAACFAGDDIRAVDLLGRLVDASLVVAEVRQGTSRYRLLETIRVYAAERLDESGPAEDARRAHAEHFLEVANRTRPDFGRFSPERQRAGLMLLDRERDNLEAAMEWTLDAGSDMALPLALALRTYWNIRGYGRQALSWLERALALPGDTVPGVRAEAAAAAALFARIGGEFERARPLAEEAIELGRPPEDAVAIATALNVLVTLAGRAGELDLARVLSAEAVATGRDAGMVRIEALSWFILAEALVNGGRYADAVEPATTALELGRTTDDREVMCLALGRLGMAAAHQGRRENARGLLVESLEVACVLRFGVVGAVCCDGLAFVAAAAGDTVRAARLLGAGEAMRRSAGSYRMPAEASARDAAFAAVRKTLDEDAIETQLELGSRLSIAEAADEARNIASM